jgi:hypothetical protein
MIVWICLLDNSLLPYYLSTSTMHMQRQPVLLVALIFGLLPVSFGQFNFFDMFGQHRHHEPQHPPSGTSQWAAHSENGISTMYVIQMNVVLIFVWLVVPCSNYLCPDTLVCVQGPSECPCPNVEDVRCVVPDVQDKGAGTVVCVRGTEECKEVEKLAKKW